MDSNHLGRKAPDLQSGPTLQRRRTPRFLSMEESPALVIELSVISYQLLIMFPVLIRQLPAVAPDMPFVARAALVGHHLMNYMIARIQPERSVKGLPFSIVCLLRNSFSINNLPVTVDISMISIFFHFSIFNISKNSIAKTVP